MNALEITNTKDEMDYVTVQDELSHGEESSPLHVPDTCPNVSSAIQDETETSESDGEEEMGSSRLGTFDHVDMDTSLQCQDVASLNQSSDCQVESSVFSNHLLEEQTEVGLADSEFSAHDENIVSSNLPNYVETELISSKHFLSKDSVKNRKAYVCDICDKVFNRSDNLKIHQRVHTNEKPYMCVVCHKTFSRSQHLTNHMRCHTGEKPFRCEVCDKRFTESKTLLNHRRVHTGERPAECDLCGKCFTHSGHLKRHMMTHTTEKPFKCGLCDKTYTRSENLEKHMVHHASNEGYKCVECNETFVSIDMFQDHMKWHAGEKVEKCEVCGKIFTKLDYLRKHMKAMHKEHPKPIYKCKHCGKVCTQRNNLKAHMRIHTGEKPYSCNVCGEKFVLGLQVNRHMKKKHPDVVDAESLIENFQNQFEEPQT